MGLLRDFCGDTPANTITGKALSSYKNKKQGRKDAEAKLKEVYKEKERLIQEIDKVLGSQFEEDRKYVAGLQLAKRMVKEYLR